MGGTFGIGVWAPVLNSNDTKKEMRLRVRILFKFTYTSDHHLHSCDDNTLW